VMESAVHSWERFKVIKKSQIWISCDRSKKHDEQQQPTALQNVDFDKQYFPWIRMFCPTWIFNLPMPQACPWRKICSCHQGPPNRQLSVDNPAYINRINSCSIHTITIYRQYLPNVFSYLKKKASMLTWMRSTKKKYVPSHRISTSVSSSQDDIEIAGSEVSEEDTFRVFCNKQRNCRNSSQFRHWIHLILCFADRASWYDSG